MIPSPKTGKVVSQVHVEAFGESRSEVSSPLRFREVKDSLWLFSLPQKCFYLIPAH